MTPFGQNWPSSWTTDGVLNGATVAAGATSSPSGAILNSAASPNEVLDTECNLQIAYGGTITGGAATVSIYRQTATGYQTSTDPVYQFTVVAVASTTVSQVFTVPGAEVGGFKIAVTNPATNSTITVTLYYRQSQGQIG